MKKYVLLLLTAIALMSVESSALALRKVDAADYNSPEELASVIEGETTFTFIGLCYKSQAYVDEDSFCMSYISYPGAKPVNACFYATEKDLKNSIGLDISPDNNCFVKVTGIVEPGFKTNTYYIHTEDGKGTVEKVDDSEIARTTYDLSTTTLTCDEIRKEIRSNLDYISASDAEVIKTEEEQSPLDPTLYRHSTWLSVNGFTVFIYESRFSDNPKQMFEGDHVRLKGTFTSFVPDSDTFRGEHWEINVL